MNIWQSFSRPILILAPMEDVTDTVFRQIVIDCGKPDLAFTEFTNVEGLCSKKGDPIVSQRLKFDKKEKPLIAQIWGKDPEHYRIAAERIQGMGYDGIDINMGCPEKSVVKNGCCSALIQNHALATEIINATKEGAGSLPVSVKTRIGFHTIQTVEWISFLLTHNLDALTIHGRTVKEESKVPCHWDEIGRCVKLRNTIAPQTLLIGNGDILSLQEAQEKITTYTLDGIMIGRGIFQNPFLFSGREKTSITKDERFQLLEKHLRLFKTIWDEKKHYPIMKKFYKMYIQEFTGASEVRQQFMETTSIEEALAMTALMNK